MGIYEKQQQLMDNVCEDISSFRTLIAPKDESKKAQYGFIPGMNNMQNEVKALDDHLHTLREGIFQVLFTGGFSAGKSTLLNALMRKELLKTSINAETAVITKIVFNADEKVTVYMKQVDEKGQPITKDYTVADFFKEYRVDQENSTKFEDVEYVQLQQKQDGIGGSLVQLVDSPGTSNSETDTEMARKFAEKASAVVYLINATQPFTYEDKEYIKSHYEGQGLKNLFFVINRADCVAENEFDSLERGVRDHLKAVFTSNGVFDEKLFNSRVFYTNALGSVNARLEKEVKGRFGGTTKYTKEMDQETGVPEFENALGAYLTDSNRDRDALAAYVPKLATVYTVAKSKAAEELEQYAAGKAELERQRDDLNVSIERVDRILAGVQATCKNIAADIVRDIKRDYDEYVNVIERDWDAHFSNKEVLKGIKFSTLDFLKVATTKNQAKKEELTKPIQKAVKAYVESKQSVLTRSVTQSVNANIVKLENSLSNYQQQLEDLNCPINISEVLGNMNVLLGDGSTGNADININGFQVILGIIGGDPEIAIGGIGGSKSNMQAIVQAIVTNVIEYIAIYVVAWPIGVAMLVARLVQMIKGVKDGGSEGLMKILCGMKTGVTSELRNAKAKVAVDAEQKARGAIIRAGETFSATFKTELSGYQKSFDDMIANLNSTNFNLSAEKERTKKLLEKMLEIISNISLLTTGNALSEREVLMKAEGNRSKN